MNNNGCLFHFKNSIKEVLTESSFPIKFLLISSIICYPLGLLLPSLFEVLVIRPTVILPPKFWVWTLLTYPFLENNIIALCFGLFCIIVASRLLEPLWGYKEFAKFLLISWTTAGVLSGLIYLAVYCLTLNEAFLYSRHFIGLAAINGAVAVGLKQTRGEDFLVKTPWVSVQINDMPFIILSSLWSLSLLLGLFSIEHCTLYTSGMYTSWLYLRFFQHHQRGQGDLADHFAMDKFFPRPINRFVKVAALLCWQIVTRFGLCKKAVGAQAAANNNQYTPVNLNLPGVDNFDAERRRQKALQQLNERLQKTEQLPTDDFSGDNSSNIKNQNEVEGSLDNNIGEGDVPSQVVAK